MILLGIVVTFAMNLLIPGRKIYDVRFVDFLTSIVITVIVWEGNLRIDRWLDARYPWITHPVKRILIHLVASVAYSGVIIFIASYYASSMTGTIPADSKDYLKITLIILASLVLMSIILLTLEISTQFFRHWKNSLVEIEKYRTQSLQAQLQNLKSQVNPHFLFNNLSVLSSLVYQDQDKSVEFINQLARVYRYLLDTHTSELVTLETELNFIRSYIFLLQIRFSPNLTITTEVPEADFGRLIPPMALQVLIENAIKHNEVSSENPLLITITSDGEKMSVTNGLQPRAVHEPGTHTGLQNITDRYAFFTSVPVEVVRSAEKFTVKIPLLANHERDHH